MTDNISFFDLTPDNELIIQAARHAEIHDDIFQMTMGYESLIGDMGMAMSQGQQQRILISRALYSQPKVLFLDEPTEEKIMNNLKSIGVTCVCNAQS